MGEPIVRVLAIAPYEGMAAALEKAAEDYPQIRLDIRIGDLEEGAGAASRCEPETYDVILSRGGTAELLQEISRVPVVSIRLSVYDVLRALQMAENYSDYYAVVGFPAVTEPAHVLCGLLGYQLEIVTVHSAHEANQALDQLRKDGCRTVVSDMVTHTAAREKGMEAFLITSGLESLRMALEEALSVSRRFLQIREENFLLRQTAREAGPVVILGENGEVRDSSWGKLDEKCLKQLRRRIPQLSAGRRVSFYQDQGGALCLITARMFWLEGARCYLFRAAPAPIPPHCLKPGIWIQEEAEVSQLSGGGILPPGWPVGGLEERLAAARGRPVLLAGEAGTGKRWAAQTIYLRGENREEPFVTADAGQMDEKNWEFLLCHEASPLNGRAGSVYFPHLELLSEKRLDQMAQRLTGWAAGRPGLIFSCQIRQGGALPSAVRDMSARLGALPIWLEPLRSRREEIPALAGRYLQTLNLELGKQIIGLEPRAAELLQKARWPGNYPQFCQTLRELAAFADGPYIRGESAAQILDRDRELERDAEKPAPWSGRRLEEIIQEAVEQSVRECGGNKTAAAAALGISRSTLWRYLRRRESGQGDPSVPKKEKK